MGTHIALLTPFTTSHRTAEETLALGYLAAVLRAAGRDVTIIDGWLENLSQEQILRRVIDLPRPLVVGMSCYRSNIEQATSLMKCLKSSIDDLKVFCGGYGPTFNADEFIYAGFDVAVRGDAEHIVVKLVEALERSDSLDRIPGIVYNDQGVPSETRQSMPITELDTLPFPARDNVQTSINGGNFVHVCTSRGCGAHCTFCSISAFVLRGSRNIRWRHRSVNNIVDEIEQLYHIHSVRNIKIVDDSFLESPRDASWACEFRDALLDRDLHIRFRTQVRADKVSPDIVAPLAEAGWFSTSVGIESAAASALKRMQKQSSVVQNQEALDALRDHGVYVQMGMILFDPYTTLDELRVNLDFLKRNTWPFTKGIFSEMYAANGTVFTRQLDARGLLLGEAHAQNLRYDIQDQTVRRVYQLLKGWHRSHSHIYDWVIDTLTAPKVVSDEIFRQIHMLCQRLQVLDVGFFEKALEHVTSDPQSTDAQLLAEVTRDSQHEYEFIRQQIATLYEAAGLTYIASDNPFI